MPTVETVEFERVAYVKEMKTYLQTLKSMPPEEAQKKSRLSLENCHILQPDGEFTERYHHSKLHFDHKG